MIIYDDNLQKKGGNKERKNKDRKGNAVAVTTLRGYGNFHAKRQNMVISLINLRQPKAMRSGFIFIDFEFVSYLSGLLLTIVRC